MSEPVLLKSDLQDLQLVKRGKVRDVYELEDKLLIVASDRMSAFDVVMDDPIPDKGKILTRISLFWFKLLEGFVENHLLSADPRDYPAPCLKYQEVLKGRSMLVKKATPLTVECIVRGYLSGSGWNDYRASGRICGISLPKGLKESQKLPEPIFTPSTKAEEGIHDENISFEKVIEILGRKQAERIKDLSIKIYQKGSEFAAQKGIIIADTKFEFGLKDGRLILIPQEIISKTRKRYIEALERLTGQTL
jgi:phosphoribosylaminoimidazole-succinocarboxamide synthase